MKLIGSLTSPYVRKVRIVMAEKKLDYAFIEENVWGADTTIQQYNPLGKVPCLIMEDGGAMFDSRVIVDYLDTLTPVGKLIPAHGRERAGVKSWEALADGVLDAGILMRLEKTLRPAEQQSQVCNQYTLADVAVGCALGWLSFRFPEINWRSQYPNLDKLFEKLSERQSFKDTVPY
jgi:glutathione S-transferase